MSPLIWQYRMFLVFGILSMVVTRAHSDAISKQMQTEDARLSTRITLSLPHASMNDVLKRLAELSHVRISANEDDGAADVQVCVFIKDMPLVEAMNGLYSLVSYDAAEWNWVRRSDNGTFQYALARPLAARQLAEELRNWTQTLFEKEAQVFMKASTMEARERELTVRQFVKENFAGQDGLADGFLATYSDRMWSGLRILKEVVPDEAKTRVLRQEERLKMDVADLPDYVRTFVQNIKKSGGGKVIKYVNGQASEMGEPGWIRFEAHRGGAKTTPSLYIMIEGLGGYAYLGGTPLEKAFRSMLLKRWTLSGELNKSDLATTKVQSPEPEAGTPADQAAPGAQATGRQSLETRMRQLAEGTPFALLARLPNKYGNEPGDPNGQTLEDYLTRFYAVPLMYKWRDNTLLVSSQTWYLEEASLLPDRLLQRLKSVALANMGYLPFGELAALSDSLDEEQLDVLARDFPVVTTVLGIKGLLSYCHQSKLASNQLLSHKGLHVDARVMEALRASPTLLFSRQLETNPDCFLRLTETEGVEKGAQSRRLTFELLSPQGTLLNRISIPYPGSIQ